MSKKSSTAEAQLILQLYDLRREPEMRKARNWVLTEFWPRNADDYLKISATLGTQENAWLRQVGSYWSMAASFAMNGAVNPEMFLQPSISGEMMFLFAKIEPFLKDLRKKNGDPESFANIEKLIIGSKYGRERLKLTAKRVQMMHETRVANKSK